MVNSMLPVLTQELGVEISTTGWLLTIYMLIQTGMMLSFGRLGDLRGHKMIYVGGMIVFIAGSVLSSMASTAGLRSQRERSPRWARPPSGPTRPPS